MGAERTFAALPVLAEADWQAQKKDAGILPFVTQPQASRDAAGYYRCTVTLARASKSGCKKDILTEARPFALRIEQILGA
jgi:hypothetical protein